MNELMNNTSNQIKLIFVYLMEKVPRRSQTQKWFTGSMLLSGQC